MNLRTLVFGILIGVLVAGGGVWVYVWWDSREDKPAPFQRLAVLPLADGDGDAAELGGMIAQELTTQLTQMDLDVIPWIRTQGYSPEEVDEAGAEFGADGLVAGSLNVEDGRVRGTIRLHDLAGGSRGWKLEIDAPRGDPLITARYIAGKIARRFEGSKEPDPEAQGKAGELVLDGGDALWEETEEDDERAKGYFIQALEIDPGIVEAYVGLATCYQRQGSDAGDQEALTMYELALELDPASAGARRGLVLMYWEMGLYENGLAVVKAMPEDMDQFDRVMIAGDAYVKCGLPHRAIPFYEEALAMKPENAGAKWGLAIACTRSGRYREAVELQLKFFEKRGDNAWLCQFTAEAYFGLGMVDSSIHYAEKTIELRQRHTAGDRPTAPVLGDLYEINGNAEKSREYRETYVQQATDYLSRNPDDGRIRTQRARIYAKLGNRDGYRSDMEVAVEQTAGNGRLCWRVGLALVESGDVDRGIEFIRRGNDLGYLAYRSRLRADGRGKQFLAAQILMKHPEWPALEAENLAREEELWEKYGIE